MTSQTQAERTAKLEARVTIQERVAAQVAAAEAGVSISEFLRRAVRDRVRFEQNRSEQVPA